MAYDVRELVLKYLEPVSTEITLGEALSVIRSKIEVSEKIVETMTQNFNDWGMGDFIECPECGSKTLLEFGGCHWCGHALLEKTFSTTPAPTEVKNSNEKVRLGNEPAALINYEGKNSVELKKDKENIPDPAPASKTSSKKELVEINEEADVAVAPKKTSKLKDDKIIQHLKDLIKEAANKDSCGKEDLKKINEMAGLNIDIKDFQKLSEYRLAVIQGLEAAVKFFGDKAKKVAKVAVKAEVVEAESESVEEVVEEPAPKKARRGRPRKDKSAPKKEAKAPRKTKAKKEEDEEVDFDLGEDTPEDKVTTKKESSKKVSKKVDEDEEEWEEVSTAKKKGPRVVVVDEDDFEDDDMEEVEMGIDTDSDEDVDAIDLNDVDADDLLQDDDMDLDLDLED